VELKPRSTSVSKTDFSEILTPIWIPDTSAIIAILQGEPERRQFNEAIESAETRSLSTASFADRYAMRAMVYGRGEFLQQR
jgi:hypothetical protein